MSIPAALLILALIALLFIAGACIVARRVDDEADRLPYGDWTRITPEMRAAEAEYLAGRDGDRA